jgi:hypothetical protein
MQATEEWNIVHRCDQCGMVRGQGELFALRDDVTAPQFSK